MHSVGPLDASFAIVNVAGIDALLAQTIPSKSALNTSGSPSAAKILAGVPLSAFLSTLNGMLEKTQSSASDGMIAQRSASPRGNVTQLPTPTDKTKDVSGDTKAKLSDKSKPVLIEAGAPPPPATPRLPVIFQSITVGTNSNSATLAAGDQGRSSDQRPRHVDPFVSNSKDVGSAASSVAGRTLPGITGPVAFALNLTPKSPQGPAARPIQNPVTPPANPVVNSDDKDIPKGSSQPSFEAAQPARLSLASSAVDKSPVDKSPVDKSMDKRMAENSSSSSSRPDNSEKYVTSSGPVPERSGLSRAEQSASSTDKSVPGPLMPSPSSQGQSRSAERNLAPAESLSSSTPTPTLLGPQPDSKRTRRSDSNGVAETDVPRANSGQAASKSAEVHVEDQEDTASQLIPAEGGGLEPENASFPETPASDSSIALAGSTAETPDPSTPISKRSTPEKETGNSEPAVNLSEAGSKRPPAPDPSQEPEHDQHGVEDYSSGAPERKNDKPQSADKPEHAQASGSDTPGQANRAASVLPFEAPIPTGAGGMRAESAPASEDSVQQTTLQPEMDGVVHPQPSRGISLKVASADSSTVDVQLRERAGRVQVTVRTPDPELARSLQSDLGDLVNRLENRGYKTEAFVPTAAHHNAAVAPGSSQGDANHAQQEHSGSRDGKQQQRPGQNESNQRRQSGQPKFREIFATEDAQKENK